MASTGLSRFKANPADVIILDVEMPNMDGVETVKAIRKVDRDVPIIMFSTLTSRGGEATMDALNAGANDYEAKPSNNSHFEETKSRIKEVLVPKIKFWFNKSKAVREVPSVKLPSPATKSIARDASPSIRSADRNFKIVCDRDHRQVAQWHFKQCFPICRKQFPFRLSSFSTCRQFLQNHWLSDWIVIRVFALWKPRTDSPSAHRRSTLHQVESI